MAWFGDDGERRKADGWERRSASRKVDVGDVRNGDRGKRWARHVVDYRKGCEVGQNATGNDQIPGLIQGIRHREMENEEWEICLRTAPHAGTRKLDPPQ